MLIVVKEDVCEFIRRSGTKKQIVMYELRQDIVEDVSMYETRMTRVNGMKQV